MTKLTLGNSGKFLATVLFVCAAATGILTSQSAFQHALVVQGPVVTPVPVPEVQARSLESLEQQELAQHIAKTWRRSPEQVQRIVSAAFQVGAQFNVPPALLLAIVAQESSFNAQAQSSYGAVGLMQVVPRFHGDKLKDLKHPDGLRHPESNILVGARVLREYWDRAGDLAQALRKYSGSATRYSAKVFRYWAEFERVKKGRAIATSPGEISRSI